MTSNATGNTETLISTTSAVSISDQSVTMLPTGGWVAVWTTGQQSDGSALTLMQRFDAAGNPVGSEKPIGDPEFTYFSPTVLPMEDGGWLIIQDRGDIVQQRFDADGNEVGGEITINQVGGDLRKVTATMLEDGGYVVAWQRGSGDEEFLQQRFDADGHAIGGEVRVNTTTSGRHFSGVVKGLDDGGWIAVWFTISGEILQQRYGADGEPVGGETRVNTSIGGVEEPSVAVLADGGWIVTWFGPDGDQDGIFQQRYNSDGSKNGTEARVSTTTASFQSNSDVAALSDGGWVVVWHAGGNQDGDGTGIYQQRYDADGNTVGAETQVNVTTAVNQSAPSVTALPSGGWIVTWQSEDPENFFESVQARVFAADIVGTDGDDELEGTPFAELILGFDGNDRLVGGRGADTLIGGAGDDEMLGGNGADTLKGFADNDDLSGGKGTDKLLGGSGVDSLSGGKHADKLFGGGGSDALNGGEGDDRLQGDAGADDLDGGVGGDKLFGKDGKDMLFGKNGQDILKGGQGNDTLNGGGGNDQLTGGAGNDKFVYKPGFGADTVHDFTDDQDTLIFDSALKAPGMNKQEFLDTFARDTGAHIKFDFGGGDTLKLKSFADVGDLLNDIGFA